MQVLSKQNETFFDIIKNTCNAENCAFLITIATAVSIFGAVISMAP